MLHQGSIRIDLQPDQLILNLQITLELLGVAPERVEEGKWSSALKRKSFSGCHRAPFPTPDSPDRSHRNGPRKG